MLANFPVNVAPVTQNSKLSYKRCSDRSKLKISPAETLRVSGMPKAIQNSKLSCKHCSDNSKLKTQNFPVSIALITQNSKLKTQNFLQMVVAAGIFFPATNGEPQPTTRVAH